MAEHIRTWTEGAFRLELYDTWTSDRYGKCVLGYKFFHNDVLVFEGNDFCPSPLYSIDGDATVAALLSFLALRPGDTDREYFADHSEAQVAFSVAHGEELGMLADELEENAAE